jgi:hypothetical protein
MLQDSILTRQRHERFLRKICQTGIVWGLENTEGFATSSTNNIQDDKEDPFEMICFWSEEALAKACAKEEWKEYNPVQIPLNDFIENWCIGMDNDGLIAGTNLDTNMFGYEARPLELVVELLKELKSDNQRIIFKKYSTIDELYLRIQMILDKRASH